MSAFKMNNQHTRAHLVQSAQQLHKNRSMSQTKAVEYRPLSSMYSSKLLEISLTGDMQKYNNVPGRHPLLLLPEDNQQGYVPNKLLLYFHGAGDNGSNGMNIFPQELLSTQSRFFILFMSSHGGTWDGCGSRSTGFGKDIQSTDCVLAEVLLAFPQITEVAIGGFSDGGTYALSLGIANRDNLNGFFSHILAWSPGYIIPSVLEDAPMNSLPNVFIAHGSKDTVLPIDRCSHKIVPRLNAWKANVTYKEFVGPHTVPPHIAYDGLNTWFGFV